MTRIKINARRIFSLLIPFFFFTSVHAEQTAAPATPVTVEAKNETFAPQHPDQYLSWKATSEQSERVDALAEDPRLVILWAGYPFSRDYNKPRGHAFAVTDVRETLRTGAPKNAEDGPLPMACWSCKSPDVARLIQKDGEDGYFHGKWARGGPEIVNNLGCADCHNTASPEFAKGKPELTLSRPYAARAMEAIGKPFEKAGRFDQQSMVCGQCHVEYYFDGKNKAVKFPWDDGMKVENMEQYYDKIAFSDWTNSLSKTPMLKAQHPEYETWTAGIHGKNNVTCIDCHMPKVQNAEGKLYTDHKIGNPFDNFAQTCANCHTQDKAALQKVVAERKQSINDLKIKVEDQLVHAHFEAKAALDAGHPVDLPRVGLFAEGVAVKRIGDETFRLCQEYLDDIITVDSDAICAAMKDLFEDVRAVAEPSGALALAGMKKYIAQHNIRGERLAHILSGANVNFHGLRYVSERCELGEQREALLAVTIPEEKGSFLKFCQLLGGRSVTEFNYRFADAKNACIFVGVRLSRGLEERKEILQMLNDGGYSVVDLSDDEMAKLHVRYMVGGRPSHPLQERLYSFEFPESPGALLRFLNTLGTHWNISLFHYRSHGTDYGRVLAAFELGDHEPDFETRLNELGYDCHDETNNPAFRFFLAG